MEMTGVALLVAVAAVLISSLVLLRDILTYRVVNELVEACQDMGRDMKALHAQMSRLDPDLPYLDPEVAKKVLSQAVAFSVRGSKVPAWECTNPECDWIGAFERPDEDEETESAVCPKCGSPVMTEL